jgi:hypothetical protein
MCGNNQGSRNQVQVLQHRFGNVRRRKRGRDRKSLVRRASGGDLRLLAMVRSHPDGSIAYLFYWVGSLSTTYEITTQRVRVERGLLSKSKENVELFRIDHFDLHEPLGMRLVGQVRLHLRSSDTSFPSVMIQGIPNLESLADTLRECSLRERTRRQVTTFVQA